MSEASEDSRLPIADDVASLPPIERGAMMTIPETCLVVLIGASGSGKSTFAAKHFRETEVLSSDHYRAVVSDDPNSQESSVAAFAALHYIAGLRLGLGRLTVIDATNVKPQDRASLVAIARAHDVLAIAIVLNLSESICQERNNARPDRQFGSHVVRNHVRALRMGLRNLEREGFRQVQVLSTLKAVDEFSLRRVPLWCDRRTETGPFDIIGDIHGCYDELTELLATLGYAEVEGIWQHPEGRRMIFLGDLVDRGPSVVPVVNLVRGMVEAGQAFCVPGNHDVKLQRYLNGRKVQVSHGLAETIAQIDAFPAEERAEWTAGYDKFIEKLVAHLVLDGGKLVVAHAGMKETYQGRASGRVRAFALYGETTGETDEFGLPERLNWAADYRGKAAVVYGHTPVAEPAWLNNTINIDTGCVYGGRLTALRWPERELITIPAHREYAAPARPLVAPTSAETAPDTLLRIEDVTGKQIIATSLMSNVIVEADRAAAALEVMSRFALDPRWLIYLPPTMSPSETAPNGDRLEYPTEAFAYFRQQGIAQVICEEKHMGSRAVLVLCKDGDVAQRRFGVPADGPSGACYTRTGRRFFDDETLNRALIDRLVAALNKAEFWERHETDWVCLDAELMPWSAKAQGLLREQYAPVAAAGSASLDAAIQTVEMAADRGVAVTTLLDHLRSQQANIVRYTTAYRAYCWDTDGLDGLRIAPFHLLATEGRTHTTRDHNWHMAELARLAEVDPIFVATTHRVVALDDETSCADATAWWEALTNNGGEGMVIKPMAFTTTSKRGLVQPAIKCRGREYLRIIYGPDYTEPDNLERLRQRNTAAKRRLALREFALGIEALERFTRHDPLYRVHQAVFGVLALESEPIDPRL